jgi:RNA polymerase sigma-70 factor (ECF subfamily)
LEDSRRTPAGQESDLLGLYMAKRANLVRFFAARLQSLSAAEDLAQDLYLKVAALDPQTPVENPMALLYRIGSNLMLDRLRGERRGVARDDAWYRHGRVSIGGEDVVDEPEPEAALTARQRLARLKTAADALPTQMGRAFRLHKLEGLSQAETARVMGISVSAVEKHLSAALKSLTRTLG